MVNSKHIHNLKKLVHGDIETNVSMKNHTSFRIGGKASVVLYPREMTDLVECIRYMKKYKIRYEVFGLGTNILVTDNDIEYVLIKLGSNFNHVTVMDNKILAYSGASLNSICMAAYNNSLSGLEDAFGIPGSIGGAVYMNAGAYTYETSNVVSTVVALVDGKLKVYENIDFSYRYSPFQDINDAIILQVELSLAVGNKQDIYNKMKSTMQKRKDSQPIDKPSAGSVYRRCGDIIVSKSIEDMGYKGKAKGGAMISPKHAGFIVNTGNAKATDVLDLMADIEREFEKKYNKKLTREIRYIGE